MFEPGSLIGDCPETVSSVEEGFETAPWTECRFENGALSEHRFESGYVQVA